jgi:hypothetical protein
MSRGSGVRGHTRSGADDELRTRGLDHGVVALCLLSYIRKVARLAIGQYRGWSCAKLLKSGRRCRRCDPSIAALRRCAGRWGEAESKQARILSESGPAAKQSVEVVRLGAGLSRMQRVLDSIELSIARWRARMRGGVASARQPHRRGTDERNQALEGSGGSDDVPVCHDEASTKKLARLSEGADCK